ncbi:MAG: TRAP transporter substrate-binding protein [Proteobacteria bacterium]|nr:TRAP transporter substrate-binding protein [Pseudomonadota bacterium]
MSNRLRYLLSIPAAGIALGAFGVNHAQAETTLVLNHYMSAKHFMVQRVVKPWGEEIAKRTNGRVKLDIPVAPLSSPPQQWSSITKGVADVSIHSDPFRRKQLRAMQVGALPFNSTTAEKSSAALWTTYQKFLKPAGEYKAVKFLSIWAPRANMPFNNKRPITKIDDFKGLKLLTGAGVAVEVLDLLGVSAVTAPGPKVFELVSKGVVDGVTMAADGVARFKVAKFMQYGTVIPGSMYNWSWSLIMNKAKWDGISKEDQATIMAISGDKLGRVAGKIFDVSFLRALDGIKKSGNQIIEASPQLMADLRKRLQPIEESYIADTNKKGVDARAALAFYKSQIK